jgi:hypothetical protein
VTRYSALGSPAHVAAYSPAERRLFRLNDEAPTTRQSVFMQAEHRSGSRGRQVRFLTVGILLVMAIGLTSSWALTRHSTWRPKYERCITHGLIPGSPPNECLVNGQGPATTVVFPVGRPQTTASTTRSSAAETTPGIEGTPGPMITTAPTTIP